MSTRVKLGYRWLGPFRVARVVPNKRTYFLKELDRTRLNGTFASRRLKIFRKREGVWDPVEIEGSVFEKATELVELGLEAKEEEEFEEIRNKTAKIDEEEKDREL
ncbi:hypothetical protein GLAREA_07935 [Glarea lozoyensis ATCC 20868]|uniref:Uncharacterized protein n=1 Tax=Glarea lozoyensis (strain ATCC 20868 / MF5171) TaxID=1116229 RepID=S3DLB0_GLAL2|nr:uncharacterized protein GLAREA_07935 [Glarea lozoyensis ATCC 20868]EPE32801.1 hypothetical protein GLAREA_07935 [Glarea lozoyensis ATCC 20868]